MHENNLIHESSPYLLQHARQPVNWYPWGEAAFAKARQEDKPVFLSIGYSTCHWCHVMAEESFDDPQIAKQLNADFVAVKVDREERPDLDSVYMTVCQAMTGSGGWPMSIFLTPEKKPIFAGTYFPKDSRQGMPGFRQLLAAVSQKWKEEKELILQSADEAVNALSAMEPEKHTGRESVILDRAVLQFRETFDENCGGFGEAPKFPTPHNLLFLLDRARKTGDSDALHMAEFTLQQMYRGGLFDHIGFGFSRYSTDRAFQIPHFEKMLYDNALLIMAFAGAYGTTDNAFYLNAAEQTADYVLREMTGPEGGFYSAQDADSNGVEGGYYALEPSEVCRVLGTENGNAFNRCYGITRQGNFEGRSIPHLVGTEGEARALAKHLPALRAYRKQRSSLHLDDKILTSWNAWMATGLSQLARASGKKQYFSAALRCIQFLWSNLQQDGRLFVSWRRGVRGGQGFLDDYAFTAFALLEIYQLAQEPVYLERAQLLCKRVIDEFRDPGRGGFFLSGEENERLILRPKETYDGAIPSGNSVMAHNLVRLSQITSAPYWQRCAEQQMEFLSGAAEGVPMGHAFYLLALSTWLEPPDRITVVLEGEKEAFDVVSGFPPDALVTVKKRPSEEYALLNGRTTYYVCTGRACLPPTNEHPCKSRRAAAQCGGTENAERRNLN